MDPSLRSRLFLGTVSIASIASIASVALIAFYGAACSDTTAADVTRPDGGMDATIVRPTPSPADAGTKSDASTCALTRAYTIACDPKASTDAGDPLNCGAAHFDSWCEANDRAINSDAYRRAEAVCLSEAHCDGLDRRDCEYRTYVTAVPSAAQRAVVAAYCATCEPSSATCATEKIIYRSALGPKSTDDVFVAAWELADPLVDAIRAKCTGSALDAGALADAGADAASCMKAFGGCAADLYLNAIPACP